MLESTGECVCCLVCKSAESITYHTICVRFSQHNYSSVQQIRMVALGLGLSSVKAEFAGG